MLLSCLLYLVIYMTEIHSVTVNKIISLDPNHATCRIAYITLHYHQFEKKILIATTIISVQQPIL